MLCPVNFKWWLLFSRVPVWEFNKLLYVYAPYKVSSKHTDMIYYILWGVGGPHIRAYLNQATPVPSHVMSHHSSMQGPGKLQDSLSADASGQRGLQARPPHQQWWPPAWAVGKSGPRQHDWWARNAQPSFKFLFHERSPLHRGPMWAFKSTGFV